MDLEKMKSGPIGVFDSGFGGLTILREMRRRLPEYDYLYLGDNARAPYGTRSFEVVYRFTLQAVRYLFSQGCPLVILACNTASAKALRSIQQNDLPRLDSSRRVLGVIRPTAEAVVSRSRNGHVGIMATPGTVKSRSYNLEIGGQDPQFVVSSQACPMWVPLVEYGESGSEGADYFVRKYVDELMGHDPQIDTVVLACTHYPLLLPKIREAMPQDVTLITQGDIVAESLADYLHRHPEMEERLSRGGVVRYMTTENSERFASLATLFMGEEAVSATHADIDTQGV